jgi:hypothetical protein
MKSKVKSMFITFFDIKGIVHKESILVGQAVNSAYYCDVLWQLHENVQRLHPQKFGDKRTGCCIMTMHCLTFPFSSGNFWQKNNMTIILHRL